VPVALRRFVDATGDSSYGQLLAMSVLSLVPTFIVFLLAQRRIVEGIATTGLKG
jgi:multiple sugar transport system permease protein